MDGERKARFGCDGECVGCDCTDQPPEPEKLVWAPAYDMYVFESDRKPCPWDMVMPCGPCDQILGNVFGIREAT